MKNTFVLMTAILLTSTAAYAEDTITVEDAVISSETVTATPEGQVVTKEPVITVDPTTAIQQNNSEDAILTDSEIEPVVTEPVENETAPDAEIIDQPLANSPGNFRNPPPLVPLVSDPSVYQAKQAGYAKCLNDAVDEYYKKKKSYRYKRNRLIANCRDAKYTYRNAVKESFGVDADFGATNTETNKIVADFEKSTFDAITIKIREKLAQEKANPPQ